MAINFSDRDKFSVISRRKSLRELTKMGKDSKHKIHLILNTTLPPKARLMTSLRYLLENNELKSFS